MTQFPIRYVFCVAFLQHLESARNDGPSSRNARLAAIKSFMRFAAYRAPSALEQILRILAIPSKKADTRLVAHLKVEELQALLDARRSCRDASAVYCCRLGPIYFW